MLGQDYDQFLTDIQQIRSSDVETVVSLGSELLFAANCCLRCHLAGQYPLLLEVMALACGKEGRGGQKHSIHSRPSMQPHVLPQSGFTDY